MSKEITNLKLCIPVLFVLSQCDFCSPALRAVSQLRPQGFSLRAVSHHVSAILQRVYNNNQKLQRQPKSTK